MEETLKILKKAKLDPEDELERAVYAPTANLASEMRKAQAEVVRIAKISSNMKDNFQKALKVLAFLMMGALEILRTRVDATEDRSGSGELRRLRAKVDQLNKAQEETNASLNAIRAETEAA